MKAEIIADAMLQVLQDNMDSGPHKHYLREGCPIAGNDYPWIGMFGIEDGIVQFDGDVNIREWVKLALERINESTAFQEEGQAGVHGTGEEVRQETRDATDTQ